ncbi:recombinase family protein [Streptomyces sp. NPDC088348]|uniref:recombinase family protein n=1 Tax=Streptomyces sp. NPDC088348 TaxID=3365853 RepID=UPI0038082516
MSHAGGTWRRSGGHSTRAIARRLNADGIPSSTGGRWSPQVVYQHLLNPVYAGWQVTRLNRGHGIPVRYMDRNGHPVRVGEGGATRSTALPVRRPEGTGSPTWRWRGVGTAGRNTCSPACCGARAAEAACRAPAVHTPAWPKGGQTLRGARLGDPGQSRTVRRAGATGC